MREQEADEREWARCIARTVLRRVLQDRRARDERRGKAREAAGMLAGRLLKERGVRRVLLFGSLAGAGGVVHAASDIDLAVEGLPADREAAVAYELGLLTELSFDLVRLEDAPEGLRRRIEAEGELLDVSS